MNAIHIIMATSSSANPHNIPNDHIENIARKRKISALTFLLFGFLLILSGFFLASSESQRFSISFLFFGTIGVILAFIYWISAERLLIKLRKFNAEINRQTRILNENSLLSQTVCIDNRQIFIDGTLNQTNVELPTYEQCLLFSTEHLPAYEQAIMKIKSDVQHQ